MALKGTRAGGESGNGERDAALDRLYRAAGHETPPARLDEAILAAARREVRARPQSVTSGLRRWRVPVSIAAVVVLSVSLVTLVKEEGGELPLPSVSAPPSPPVERSSKPAQAVTPPAAGALTRGQAAVPAAARPAVRDQAGAGASDDLRSRGDDSVSAQRARASKDATSGDAAEATARLNTEPKRQPQSQPQSFQESSSSPEPGYPAAPPASPAGSLAARAPAVAERRTTPLPAASAPKAADSTTLRQATSEAAPGHEQLPAWHNLEKEAPQRWIERINELRVQQRTAEAEAVLAEFKRRFPDYPLPGGNSR